MGELRIPSVCFTVTLITIMLGSSAGGQQWSSFNGDPKAQKYSPAAQITPENVRNLKKVWELHTGDVWRAGGGGPKTAWSATPLFVNDNLYVGTPKSLVLSIRPDSGKVNWVYDSKVKSKNLAISKSRGLAYWQNPTPVQKSSCQKILYVGTEDGDLHAIDAQSGKRCSRFGNQGILNVNQWNNINPKLRMLIRQPPAVFKDTLILGWAMKDWVYENSPPGSVFGIDAETGKLKWTFQTIPKEVRDRIGTANVWASMSVDTENGLVYLPVSSPEANFYGGNRKTPIPFATSVTALNASSGKVVWSRQLVHHDLWDYDTDSAPTLVDIKKEGVTIPALVQSSKQGFLYILNRLTGVPIYPIVEKSVPRSDVPGESASPTQPYVAVPAPTVPDRFPGISKLADFTSLGYCTRTYSRLRDDGRFTPPSIRGSIAFPGTVGGVEWGGGAVDPVSQTYVVNSSNVVQIFKLIPRSSKQSRSDTKESGSPQYGTPYAISLAPFLSPLGLPCWKPPYGTLSSYNLSTGKLLWRRPFGVVQKWGFYMPTSWGSVTLGPPMITRSGLIFIGASMDSRVRAIDLRTGDVLWQATVDAPAASLPATFIFKGKQYLVFTAGGNGIVMPKLGDQVVAFALPN